MAAYLLTIFPSEGVGVVVFERNTDTVCTIMSQKATGSGVSTTLRFFFCFIISAFDI